MQLFKKYMTTFCFGAKWVSPETNKKVTALHFSSYLDPIRKKHNLPLYKKKQDV